MLHKCFYCQKEFEAASSNRKFCSNECYNKYCAEKTPIVHFRCENCGKAFTRTLRSVLGLYNRGQTVKYCSFECKEEAWGKHRVKQKCYICGKDFLIQQKNASPFACCSNACAQHSDHNFHTSTKIKLYCQQCGKEFEKTLQYINHEMAKGRYPQFCSVECRKKSRQDVKNKVSRIKRVCPQCGQEFTALQSSNGIIKGKYCGMQCYREATAGAQDSYHIIRSRLNSTKEYQQWRWAVLKRDNYKCVDCGCEEKLHVHHKYHFINILRDYNFDIEQIKLSPIFNDIDNGETVCISCHRKRHPYNQYLEEMDNLSHFCRQEPIAKVIKKVLEDNSGIKLEKARVKA